MENYVFKILLAVFLFVFNVSSCRAPQKFIEDGTLNTKVENKYQIIDVNGLNIDVTPKKQSSINRQLKINKQKLEEAKKIEENIEKREQLKSDLENLLQKLDSI